MKRSELVAGESYACKEGRYGTVRVEVLTLQPYKNVPERWGSARTVSIQGPSGPMDIRVPATVRAATQYDTRTGVLVRHAYRGVIVVQLRSLIDTWVAYSVTKKEINEEILARSDAQILRIEEDRRRITAVEEVLVKAGIPSTVVWNSANRVSIGLDTLEAILNINITKEA